MVLAWAPVTTAATSLRLEPQPPAPSLGLPHSRLSLKLKAVGFLGLVAASIWFAVLFTSASDPKHQGHDLLCKAPGFAQKVSPEQECGGKTRAGRGKTPSSGPRASKLVAALSTASWRKQYSHVSHHDAKPLASNPLPPKNTQLVQHDLDREPSLSCEF